MGLAAEGMEIATDPVARGLLGAVGVAIIAEPLAPLVHQREAGMRAQCRGSVSLACQSFAPKITLGGNHPGKPPYMDSKQAHFPDLRMHMTIRGTSVPLSGVIWPTTFR
jgi:hypothetical protein